MLPDEWPVRSETRRSLIFKNKNIICELYNNCVHLLVNFLKMDYNARNGKNKILNLLPLST